jgi:hypothetical protein
MIQYLQNDEDKLLINLKANRQISAGLYASMRVKSISKLK